MLDRKSQVFQLVDRGEAAYRAGEYENAKRLYREAIDFALRSGVESNFIYSLLVQVYKKTQQYSEAIQISRKALPTPAAFRDCATILRKQAQEAKKCKDAATLSLALDELYRLAVLASLCYGSHDCKSSVAGLMFERAVFLCERLPVDNISCSYAVNGALPEGGLLNERDNRTFADAFGENRQRFDPIKAFPDLTNEANQYLQKKIVEQANLFPGSTNESVQREVQFLSRLYPFAF